MFEQAVQVSEAMQGAACRRLALVPALAGCRVCGRAHMIASPALGVCEECGAELTVLGGATPLGAD